MKIFNCPLSERFKKISFLCIGLIFSVWILSSVKTSKYHGDESFWISRSFQIDLLMAGTNTGLYWQEYTVKVDPPLTRYVIGLALKATGFNLNELKIYMRDQKWRFKLSELENTRAGNLPDRRIVLISRLAITIFAIGGLFLTMHLTKLLGGSFAGITAGYLYATNSLVQNSSVRATGDGLLIFFILLALMYSIKYNLLESSYKKLIIFGAILGWGLSAKLTILLCFPAVFAALGIETILKNRKLTIKEGVQFLKVTVTVLLSAWSAFVLIAPGIWTRPIYGFLDFFTLRYNWLHRPKGRYFIPAKDRLEFAFTRTFDYIERKQYLSPFSELSALFFAIGLGLGIFFLFKKRRSVFGIFLPFRPALYFLTWTLIFYFGIARNLTLDWDRYYLPLCVIFIPWIAVGFSVICKLLVTYGRKTFARLGQPTGQSDILPTLLGDQKTT